MGPPESSGLYRLAAASVWCWIPPLFGSQPLLLKTFADRLCIYHGEKLIATHTRSYDRHQDFEDPDHGKELLDQRRAARDAKLLLSISVKS